VTLRRGFKSEADSIARELREELGLGVAAPLDVHALAHHLDIEVRRLSSLASRAPREVTYLAGRGYEAFSAVTVFRGTRREVWHNDSHAPGRQASNIAHELGHAILLHPAGMVVAAGRDWDPTQEEEAQWLAGALLVSEEAAVMIARTGRAVTDMAAEYGVSESLLNWRLGVTGARIRMQRAAAKYGRQLQA
jgi:Zn-dependent peptidase ImmA (M78 family)